MQENFHLHIFLIIDFFKFPLILSRWCCLGFPCPKTWLGSDVSNYLNACQFFLMLLLWFVRGILGNRVWNFLMILRFDITCILWTKINHPRSVLFCIIWVGQVLLRVCKLLMNLQVFNGEHSSQGKSHFIIRHLLWSTTSLRPGPWHLM